MLVNLPPVVRGVVAVVPPLVALIVAYARYDGFFKDQTIFLYYMGGLGVGLVVALLDVWTLFTTPLLFLVGGPLIAQLGKMVAVNLPRWQGEPHAVFNGGACGAGVGTMLVFAYGEALIPDTGELLRPALLVFALGAGVSLVHFATGVVVGEGVATHRVATRLAVAVAVNLPLALFTFEAIAGVREAGVLHPLWAILALLYGVAAFEAVRRAVLPKGLTTDARRELRRRARSGLD